MAFSEVVDHSLRDPNLNKRIRAFLHFERVEQEGDGLFGELSEAESEDTAKSQQPRWRGYYGLNFHILPRVVLIGWTLGSGALESDEQEVDLLLTAKTSPYRVGSRHAILSCHEESGCLQIYATKRRVYLYGSFGVITLQNNKRALTEAVTIGIGDLLYSFAFTGVQADTYQADLTSFMTKHRPLYSFTASRSISTAGSDIDIQLKDYTIKQDFAGGSTCTVSSGIKKATGDIIAIKRIEQNTRNLAMVMHESVILQEIGSHVSHSSQIKDKSSEFDL